MNPKQGLIKSIIDLPCFLILSDTIEKTAEVKPDFWQEMLLASGIVIINTCLMPILKWLVKKFETKLKEIKNKEDDNANN